MTDRVMFNKVRLIGDEVELREYIIPFNCGNRINEIKKKDKEDKNEDKQSERYRESLVRTRSSIYDICRCNVGDFPKFLTLTCKESILNYDDFLYEMKQFFKKMKRKGYDLRYLWVAEHQTERGKKEGNEGSYHAHVIIFNNEYIPFEVINSCWCGNTDIHIFNKVRYIDNMETDEKIRNVCSYVVKYITKEMCEEFGRNLYHCSRGLFRPVEFREEYISIYDSKNQLCHYQKNNNNQCFDYLKDRLVITNVQAFTNKINDTIIGCQVSRGYLKNE